MKFKYILSIVTAIILLHLVVVWFFMRAGNNPAPQKSSTAGAPAASGTEQSISEAIAASKAARQAQTAGNAGQQTSKTSIANLLEKRSAAAQTSDKLTTKVFTPYNYEFAVKGNIPEIPSSASATSGILLDPATRTVLWAKNPEEAFPIASMTKIMTNFLAYEDVLNNRNGLTLDTPIKVTRAAAKIGGSQVWLDPTETFTLEELMVAVSLKSANDAAYLIAEYLGGGDADAFVTRMNKRAREIGMKHTRFFNSHGLPGSSSRTDNVSSPADMALLTEYTLEYPYLMKWASTARADFRAPGTRGYLRLINHNNLLEGAKSSCPGVDGLKTGFIDRSGFCVTVTCKRDGKRLIAMVTGFHTARERDLFVKKLLAWGYPRMDDPAAALAESRKKALQVRSPAAKSASAKKTTRTVKKKTKDNRE